MDRRTFLLAVAAVTISVASGCASSQGALEAPTIDVTGQWIGTIGSRSLSLTLKEVGARVEGDQAVGGFPAASGAIAGEVSANRLNYATIRGYGGHLTVNGEEMTGRSISGFPIYLRRQK
jgi:hypothetical protein